MGALEDTRKILQDFIAPELRGIQVRLDSIDQRFVGIDQRFAALEHRMADDKAELHRRMADDKAELLRTIDFMLRELSLRIELASGKNRVAEAAPVKGASIEHQQ